MKQNMLKKEYTKLLVLANKYRNKNISMYIKVLVRATAIREKLDAGKSVFQLG